MINNKLNASKGPRSGFRMARKLRPILDRDSLTTWTLSNSLVSFTFIEDPDSGVRLDRWQHVDFTAPVYNSSSDLWSLGMVSNYEVLGSDGVYYFPYVVKPNVHGFQAPSTTPVVVSTNSSFTFIWENVQLDNLSSDKTCTVTVIASLEAGEESLDLSVSVEADKTYSASDLQLGNTSILQYLGFPTIAIKNGEEADNENTIFSDSRYFGQTISNPHKYLRAARDSVVNLSVYAGETFQQSSSGRRLVAAGDIGYPNSQINKYNYGTPGSMAMPAFVFGDRAKKEGTLIYALDQDGTNPKQFQWYSDDGAIYIKSCHNSDDFFDPNAVGGYYVEDGSTLAPLSNSPRWTLRILPFKSPTRWVDWKGFQKYREATLQKNMSYGWMPDSFYNRYVAGELSKDAAEIPMVINAAGFTTGDLGILTGYKDIYANLYRESINPNFTGNPRLPIHLQSASLNAGPKTGTDPNEPAHAWWGWEPWGNAGTGVGNVGPDVYLMPDITGLHPNYGPTLGALNNQGNIPYVYSIFPFTISTGSEWTQQYDAIDLCSKVETTLETRLTNEQYDNYARNEREAGIFSFGDFKACIAIDHNLNQEKVIAGNLGSAGVGQYHDTAGVYGRGCMAKDHVFLSGEEDNQREVTVTHPRSPYSRYYNNKQYNWLQTSVQNHTSGFVNNFDDKGISSGDFNLAHAGEHLTELNIGVLPVGLHYEGASPYFSAFGNFIEKDPRTDTISNTSIDNSDDATVAALIAASKASFPNIDVRVGCTVDPPNWHQRCPAFNIAYSDRVVLNEWINAHISNFIDIAFTTTAATGTGQYGQLFYETAVYGLAQREQWNCSVLNTWPYTNTIGVSHIDESASYTTPAYAALGLDNQLHESETGFTGVWSGYKDGLIQRALRVQAYNPDYMYHGTFYQPLDDYEVDISTAGVGLRRSFKVKPPNLRDPVTGFQGNEKITHFVRKHRNSDKFLFVAGNWTTGQAEFTGTFDPTAYDIDTSYQVRTLEVNSGDHGTWSLVTNKAAEETYTIDLSLGEAEFAVYAFEADSSTLSDFYSDLVTDYAPVSYQYGLKELSTTDLTVAYTYDVEGLGSVAEKQEGYKAPATQEILNNLPQWMKARQSTVSDAWKLTNSWGMSLENTIKNVSDHAENLSLLTIRKYPLHEVEYVSLRETVNNDYPTRNLLFNSSFAIKDVARSKMPLGWTNHKENTDLQIDKKQSTIVPYSLKSELGIFKFGQDRLLENVQVDKVVGSIYVLADIDDLDIEFTISAELIDGSSKVFKVKHSNRSEEWVRLSLPCQINAQVYRLNFIVNSTSTGLVRIAAPQLEFTSLSGWTKSNIDYLPYYDPSLRFNSVYALPRFGGGENIPIYTIGNEDQFLQSNIPTRLERQSSLLEDIDLVTDTAAGRRVGQLGETLRTEFVALEEQLVERSLSPSKFDIYGRYDIRDLRTFEDLLYGTRTNALLTIKPVATAVRNDMLFVLCKETYQGTTRYIIKTVVPRVPPNGETYLESLIDFDLNLEFDKTYALETQFENDIASLSFSENNPNYLIVTSTNNIKYYYRMYFDYAYYNVNNSRLYFREKYPDSNLVIS